MFSVWTRCKILSLGKELMHLLKGFEPSQPAQSVHADVNRNVFAILKCSARQTAILHLDSVGCLTKCILTLSQTLRN